MRARLIRAAAPIRVRTSVHVRQQLFALCTPSHPPRGRCPRWNAHRDKSKIIEPISQRLSSIGLAPRFLKILRSLRY